MKYFIVNDMQIPPPPHQTNFFLVKGLVPHSPNGSAPLEPACIGITGHSRNRLVSTAYFAKQRYAASLPNA